MNGPDHIPGLGNPVGECSRCHRKIYAKEEIGAFCKLPAPVTGVPCPGVFVAIEDVPAVTVPDEATTIRARCAVCKAVAYSVADIGTRCKKIDKKTGRRCYGLYEGSMTEEDEININGDKVIEFAKAVRALGDLFESMNIIGLKDLFLMGRKCQAIEDILAEKKKWNEALADIRTALNEKHDEMERSRISLDQTIDSLERLDKVLYGTAHIRRMEHLRQLLSLCDQLEAHRKSGVLEIVATLTKQPPL